jgi:cell filamentation protein
VSDDPYADPVTGVLYNRLGIDDAARLDEAEAGITRAALVRLQNRTLPGRYDLDHLRAFHRAVFKDLYDWAGEIRTVGIAKGKGEVFCLPRFIEPYAAEVFRALAAEGHLRGLDRDTFVARLAYYVGEINAIHPFREGNGRAQRAFFRQLTLDAGHFLNWQGLDANENVATSIAIMRGDPEPMRRMLDRLVEQA